MAARQELTAAKLYNAILDALEDEFPPTAAAREELADILRPAVVVSAISGV